MKILSRLLGKRGPDFSVLCTEAMHDLKAKSVSHQALWGMGNARKWDLDPEQGKLVFTFHEKIVTCEAQVVGTWNSSMWLWAWSNLSTTKKLTHLSKLVRAYGEQHRIPKLTTGKWEATEEDAWQMAAVAQLLGKARGVYRGLIGDVFVFITFGTPKIERK